MDINEPQTEQPAPSGGRNNLKSLLFIGVLVLAGAVVARSVLTNGGNSGCGLFGTCSSGNGDAAAVTSEKTAGCSSKQGCAQASAGCPSARACKEDPAGCPSAQSCAENPGCCASAQGCCPDATACSLEAAQSEPSACCPSAAPATAGCCSRTVTE